MSILVIYCCAYIRIKFMVKRTGVGPNKSIPKPAQGKVLSQATEQHLMRTFLRLVLSVRVWISRDLSTPFIC